jgi:hypothetical protein
MYNLGDDSELDRLSREAAGRYQHPGKPNWQQMEAELDKTLPTAKKRRFGALWLLPVLLAAGGAAYWLSTRENSDTTNSPVTQSIPKSEANIPGSSDKNNTVAPLAQPIEQKTAQSSVAMIEQKQHSAPRGHTQHAAVPSQSSSSNNNKGSVPAIILAAQNESSSSTAPAPKQEQRESQTVAENKKIETKTETDLPVEQVKTIAETTTPDNKPADTKEPAPMTSRFNKEPLPFGKGWSWGLVTGVDQSTVKFAYSSGAGYNAGITVGYHFNNKWSLHTGAIYTHKNYKMNGSDFTPPKGSWVNYYKLENVDGQCSMWEVPLLARYSFAQHGRNSFFVSTGLSSYFMTHENYSYFFYFNNQPVTRAMDYKSDDTHLLSILHLSVGYEHQVSNKLSMLIEPYAKLPLAGVGLGNIQLSSFGLNFSLQMRQPAHR